MYQSSYYLLGIKDKFLICTYIKLLILQQIYKYFSPYKISVFICVLN